MENKIRGVIFDFNGVLLWDTPQHDTAWRKFSATLRGYPLTDEEMQRLHGRTNKGFLEYILDRQASGTELATFTNQKESYYRQLCLDLGPQYQLSPGSIDVLDTVTKKNIPRTIATSSEKSNLDFFIQQFHLDRWFDTTKFAYDDGSVRGKPAPDLYHQAAKNLGLPPANCLVIEDAPSGIASAYAATIGTLIALGPAERHEALRRLPGVVNVITTVGDLLHSKYLANPVE